LSGSVDKYGSNSFSRDLSHIGSSKDRARHPGAPPPAAKSAKDKDKFSNKRQEVDDIIEESIEIESAADTSIKSAKSSDSIQEDSQLASVSFGKASGQINESDSIPDEAIMSMSMNKAKSTPIAR
jgi:hypothetical protein